MISIYAFSGKIPFHVAARLTVRFWVPSLLRFATIRHYSRLFAIIHTIRDYSHYSYYSLFGSIRYWLFSTIRYSGFPDTRYNVSSVGLLLILPPFNEVCHCVYTTKNFTSVK